MSDICGHGSPSEQIIFLYVDAHIYSGYIIAEQEGNLNYKYII